MLETLRLENAQVLLSLVSYNTTIPSFNGQNGKSYPPVDEFVYLRTKITNTSPFSQIFTVDFVMEPTEHIVYEGIISELAAGRLNAGESREVDIGICFLAYGRFEISAEVRSFGHARSDIRAGIGRLVAIVRVPGST